MYRVFTRTWWKRNPSWPDGREPGPGPKSYAGHPSGVTEEEARAYCQRWNRENDPGFLGLKAEFEAGS